MARQPYRPVSESYLLEYLGYTYPPGSYQTNVPLGEAAVPAGMILTDAERRFISKPWQPYADAVVLLPREVVLIECKVRDDRGKLEQLLEYDYLFPRTVRYRDHWNKPRHLVLLTPKDQGEYTQFLKKYGVDVVIYAPNWILEYLGSLPTRARRGTGGNVRM